MAVPKILVSFLVVLALALVQEGLAAERKLRKRRKLERNFYSHGLSEQYYSAEEFAIGELVDSGSASGSRSFASGTFFGSSCGKGGGKGGGSMASGSGSLASGKGGGSGGGSMASGKAGGSGSGSMASGKAGGSGRRKKRGRRRAELEGCNDGPAPTNPPTVSPTDPPTNPPTPSPTNPPLVTVPPLIETVIDEQQTIIEEQEQLIQELVNQHYSPSNDDPGSNDPQQRK